MRSLHAAESAPRRGRPKTPVDVAAVLHRRSRGEATRSIAKDLGVSPAILYARLRKAGQPASKVWERAAAATYARMKELHAQGLPHAAIADRLNREGHKLSRELRRVPRQSRRRF